MYTASVDSISVTRPDDDRLKRPKHVATYTINIVVLDVF